MCCFVWYWMHVRDIGVDFAIIKCSLCPLQCERDGRYSPCLWTSTIKSHRNHRKRSSRTSDSNTMNQSERRSWLRSVRLSVRLSICLSAHLSVCHSNIYWCSILSLGIIWLSFEVVCNYHIFTKLISIYLKIKSTEGEKTFQQWVDLSTSDLCPDVLFDSCLRSDLSGPAWLWTTITLANWTSWSICCQCLPFITWTAPGDACGSSLGTTPALTLRPRPIRWWTTAPDRVRVGEQGGKTPSTRAPSTRAPSSF